MKIILNDHPGVLTLQRALAELVRGADTLSLAVSYLRVSGWQLFQQHTSGLSLARMRMVCTDQMDITQPAAVTRAMSSHVQIRHYTGPVTFHPKVYLAHDARGRPTRFLITSANLSSSALTDSVEAGVLGDDAAGLRVIHRWFDHLFDTQSAPFTPERLRAMEEAWRRAATYRARARLRTRQGLVMPPGKAPVPIEPEDLDALEDIFATVQVPIGLLNMDYGGNNVRNLELVCKVLASWKTVASPGTDGKQRSEMKLLGFSDGKVLTTLGHAAAAAGSPEEVARLWCSWLQRTPDTELARFGKRLPVAKRVLAQFWQLQGEVRDYFLANAVNPDDRQKTLLQTIELLCNASDVIQGLSLDDFKQLAILVNRPERLPPFIQEAVAGYQGNKGARSWNTTDRRVIPLAWQRVVR